MTYDIRKKSYAAGEAYGIKTERARLCDQLESIAGSDDLQGAVLQLISQLQEQPAPAASTTTSTTTSSTTTEQLVARAFQVGAKHTQTKDLGDEVAALMAAKRGKSLSSQPASTRRDSSIIDWSTR